MMRMVVKELEQAPRGHQSLLCECNLELVGLYQSTQSLHDLQKLAIIALNPLAYVAPLHLSTMYRNQVSGF